MKIYLLLTNNIQSVKIEYYLFLQKEIVKFISENLKNKIDSKIELIFNNKHIIEERISHIDRNNSIVLWHPLVAFNNLELVKKFKNSIVILPSKTVLTQYISENNPINENLALNHNFKILYMNTDSNLTDITNLNYQILGYEEDYLIDTEKIINIINNTNKNE